DVEEAEEGVVAGRRLAAAPPVRHDADGVDEEDGDGGGEPGDEEDKRLGVVAVDGEVELRDDGAVEAHEAFKQAQHDAPALREVLDAGHQRPVLAKDCELAPTQM
ncbi:unnamed protein product, partial [Urochloa humidicola]